MESWRLSAQDMRRVSDHKVRDIERPIDGDVARMSIPRVHRIQVVEGCR